ncbi:MAG: hypothetical protein K0S47_2842 [Herbinix sp.]|nr:hypothetical protein [Herbinix sp.]
MPREELKYAANAIGSVLNGLSANPIAGKNTGADWNMTAIVVNIPPILMNRTTFILFNLNAPFPILKQFQKRYQGYNRLHSWNHKPLNIIWFDPDLYQD